MSKEQTKDCKENRKSFRREEDKKLFRLVESQRARERALLLYHSLVSANYQNRIEKVGIRQFINRLQMLLQEPIVIVLLSKMKSTSRRKSNYLVLLHTMLDPMWKKYFERELKDKKIGATVKGDNLIIPSSNCMRGLFKVHDDKYLMFFRVSFDSSTAINPPRFQLILRSSEDGDESSESKASGKAVDPVLNEFLSYFKSVSDQDQESEYDKPRGAEYVQDIDSEYSLISESLNAELNSRSSKKFWDNGVLRERESDIDLSYNFGLATAAKEGLERIYEESFVKISAVFDAEYEKIRDSYLLKYNEFQPPNIMFAVRFFDAEMKRFKGAENEPEKYPYGVRGLIPKRQKDDVLNALEVLNEIQHDPRFRKFARSKKRNIFYFPKPYIRGKSYEHLDETDFPSVGNRTYGGTEDEFFWEKIKDQKGREEILEELEKPYSLAARSLSDIVFSGGYLRVAPEPYVETGGIRLEPHIMMRGAKELDYRKTVYYHYLMSMAAHGGGGMSALILPGHVNGSPWFSMGYYFTSAEDENERWLNCYHFYHSVALYFIRGIRSGIKKLFLDEIKSVFQEMVYDKIPRKFPNQSVTTYPELVNPHFRLLCRIYPFDKVELVYAGVRRRKERTDVISIKGFSFIVKLEDNPYFDKTSSAKHIEVSEVVDKLRDK